MFRNLLLVLYEALTGYTVVTDGFREVTTQNKNIQIPNYRVVKKGEDKKRKKGEKKPTGIEHKTKSSDYLTQYLIPQFANKMGYDHIVAMNCEAINRLKTMEETRITQSKMTLISNFNVIIGYYVKEAKVAQKAKECFVEYMASCFPEEQKVLRHDFRS